MKVSEEIKQKYNEAIFDEVKNGIIIALEFYDSLNLKRLAELIGRPETTTIRYVKKLLDDGLITLDVNKTASDWGKFYKLSDSVNLLIEERIAIGKAREKWIFEEMNHLDGKSDEEIRELLTRVFLSKENIEFDFQKAKQTIEFVSNVQKMIINDSNLVIKELIEIYNEKGMEYLERNLDMSPSDIETWHISLKLHSIKQMADLVKLFYKWFNELLDFKSKTDKEMNELDIPEDQRFEFFLYSFMGSMKFNVVLKDED